MFALDWVELLVLQGNWANVLFITAKFGRIVCRITTYSGKQDYCRKLKGYYQKANKIRISQKTDHDVFYMKT